MAIRSRDSRSVLPRYFFWSFSSSGWTSIILRWLRICLTKTGIRAALTNKTRPTMASTHEIPESKPSPRELKTVWKLTRINSISHLIGHKRSTSYLALIKPDLQILVCRSVSSSAHQEHHPLRLLTRGCSELSARSSWALHE